MSNKTELLASMKRAEARLGGSHGTHENRRKTIIGFVAFVCKRKYTHLKDIRHVRGRYVKEFIIMRLDSGVNKRTLQNEMAHFRMLWRASGLHAVANATELSNKALGIDGAPRGGKKVAISDEQFYACCKTAVETGRHGISLLLRLQHALGLRANEAICANLDTLLDWKRCVDAKAVHVYLTRGAKTGRPRWIEIQDHILLQNLLTEAVTLASKQSGYLILRANGKGAGGLKQAQTIYRDWCYYHGFQSHALRYAWAQNRYRKLASEGIREKEILRRLAIGLGHGESRHYYVKSVYLKGMQMTFESSD